MPGPIYVIGHKHSDLDSVASAYGYARLLQLQGEAQPIAARQGELKPEVRFVLERFHVGRAISLRLPPNWANAPPRRY